MFISNAYAQAAGGATEGFSLQTMLLPALMIVVFYFLLIRPQQKRAKDQKTMMEALQVGDEVITTGGILGRIAKIGDAGQYLTLDVSQSGTSSFEIVVQKGSVATLLPKGTLKSI